MNKQLLKVKTKIRELKQGRVNKDYHTKRNYVCRRCNKPFKARKTDQRCPFCGHGKPWRGGLNQLRSRKSELEHEKNRKQVSVDEREGGETIGRDA